MASAADTMANQPHAFPALGNQAVEMTENRRGHVFPQFLDSGSPFGRDRRLLQKYLLQDMQILDDGVHAGFICKDRAVCDHSRLKPLIAVRLPLFSRSTGITVTGKRVGSVHSLRFPSISCATPSAGKRRDWAAASHMPSGTAGSGTRNGELQFQA